MIRRCEPLLIGWFYVDDFSPFSNENKEMTRDSRSAIFALVPAIPFPLRKARDLFVHLSKASPCLQAVEMR